jgi:hypothetical protein
MRCADAAGRQLLCLPFVWHHERMLVMSETSYPRELSDAEMREWVATVRRGVANGALLAQSNTQAEIVSHLEEERRRLNR